MTNRINSRRQREQQPGAQTPSACEIKPTIHGRTAGPTAASENMIAPMLRAATPKRCESRATVIDTASQNLARNQRSANHAQHDGAQSISPMPAAPAAQPARKTRARKRDAETRFPAPAPPSKPTRRTPASSTPSPPRALPARNIGAIHPPTAVSAPDTRRTRPQEANRGLLAISRQEAIVPWKFPPEETVDCGIASASNTRSSARAEKNGSTCARRPRTISEHNTAPHPENVEQAHRTCSRTAARSQPRARADFRNQQTSVGMISPSPRPYAATRPVLASAIPYKAWRRHPPSTAAPTEMLDGTPAATTEHRQLHSHNRRQNCTRNRLRPGVSFNAQRQSDRQHRPQQSR